MKRGRPWMALSAASTALAVAAGCATRQPTLGASEQRLAAAERLIARTLRAAPLNLSTNAPLTLMHAVRRALAFNAEVRGLEADVRIAGRAIRAARDGRDPELRFSYGEEDEDQTSARSVAQSGITALSAGAPYTGASTGAESGTESSSSEAQSIALRMFPRNPWERSAAVAGARSAWYAAQADLRQATVTVALDTCRAFEDLRFFTEDLALVEEVAAVRRDLVRQTDDMLKAGRLSAMEGVQARQRYLQALADCARGRQAWTDARQSLAACVGLAPAAVQLAAVELAPLDALALEVPDQDVTSAALSNRADVAALGWRSRAAHAAYREVLAARIPWFSFVQGAYASTETASDASSVSTKAASTVATVEQRTQNSDAEEWRIDAGIVLPIFSWMNGEAALRRTEYEKACVLEAQAILDVPRQVAAARDRLRTQASQMCRYAEESQVTIRELESLLAPGSPSGELAPEDAARAREELIQVRRLEVAAGHQRNAALFDLHAAMGTLPVATVELPPPAW